MALSVAERKAKLQKQLQQLEKIEEQERNGRFIVIGKAVSSLMETNEEFRSTIMKIVDERTTKNADREIVNLPKRATNRGRPARTTEHA